MQVRMRTGAQVYVGPPRRQVSGPARPVVQVQPGVRAQACGLPCFWQSTRELCSVKGSAAVVVNPDVQWCGEK